jgi:hypothetical protein
VRGTSRDQFRGSQEIDEGHLAEQRRMAGGVEDDLNDTAVRGSDQVR